MRPNPLETADLAISTEEIINGKLHFLCSDMCGAKIFKVRRRSMNTSFETNTEGLLSMG